MPNLNQTLNSINQGMKILEMAQGKGTSKSHSTSSSNYPQNYPPPSNFPQNYPSSPSNYPQNYPSSPSHYPSSSSSSSNPMNTLTKIVEGVGHSFLSPPSKSGNFPSPTGSPSPSSSFPQQNLVSFLSSELSYHQNAIMNLRNEKERTERNGKESLRRNEGKIFQLIDRLKGQESYAQRGNDLAQSSHLSQQWQQLELSFRSRQENHRLSLERNLFDFEKAIQQHQFLIETLSRQLSEVQSGICHHPPPPTDRSIRDPIPYVIPDENQDDNLSYGGYSSMPPRTPSPSYQQMPLQMPPANPGNMMSLQPPSFSGNMPPSYSGSMPAAPGYYSQQSGNTFLGVPANLSPSGSPLPSPPLNGYSPPSPNNQAIGFRF